MKTEKEKKWYWFSVAAFLLGLLSNVKIFTLPLMFLFYEWFYGSLKKRWKYLIPYFLSSFGIILLFISGVNTRITQVSAGQNQPIGYDNIFVTIPLAIGWYIKLIFWPQILTLYHSTLIYSRPEFFLYVGITICYFVALTVAFKKNKLIFFWLMLFILNIAFSLTPLRLSWTVAERYAYISYIGILVPSALGIAFLLKRYKKYEGLIWVSFFLTISILFIRTFVRNIDWQTQDNLWLATAEASPTSPTARNNMGLVYFKQGDYEGAIQEFQTSLKLNPNNANAWHNMGNAYRLLKQDEKAVECFQKALALDPKLWQSDEYIAAIYFEHQQYQEALPYLQKAMELRPDDTRLMFNAAALYFQMNQREQAKQEFEKILSIDPNNADAKEGLKEIDR